MTLDWTGDRWHLDGLGIHAGCRLEVCWPDGTWELVRVESMYHGQRLLLCIDYHGGEVSVLFDKRTHELRWPRP